MIDFDKPPKNEKEELKMVLFLILTCPTVAGNEDKLTYLAHTAERLLGKFTQSEQAEIDKTVHQAIADERLHINEDVFDFLLPESQNAIH